MNRIIWDWHGDEYNRIKRYVGGKRYIGDSEPIEYDELIAPDGHWLYRIKNKEKVIVYPCVKNVEHIKALGYKRAYTKDKAQTERWGEGAICLPPLMNISPKGYDKTMTVTSIVQSYAERDPKGYSITTDYGVKIYGFPNNPTWEPESIIEMSNFLFHAKEIGYLCNVVIKAISLGTPCIFTPESFTFGYSDYLTPNVDCFIVNNKQEFNDIVNMPPKQYLQVVSNIFKAKDRIIDMSIKAYNQLN